MMKKRNGLIVLLAGVFVFLSCATNKNVAQEQKGRYYETAGAYSILLPGSWQPTEFEGLKYKILMGSQETSGFVVNIVIVDEAFGGDLEYYVDTSVYQLIELYGNDITIWQRTEFVTQNNLKGERVLVSMIQGDTPVRQIHYFFPGYGKKIVLICTVLAEAGEIFDGMFDEIVGTFEWTD